MVQATFDPMGHITCAPDIRALIRLAKSSCPEGHRPEVVEIGTWAGGTAIALADSGCKVYCVDHWQGSPNDPIGRLASEIGTQRVWQTFCKNVGPRLLESVFPCVGSSKDWASIWPRQVDMVFIDASHDYADVREDIKAWLPHVKQGGILCGHDYGSFPGVTLAADEFGKDGTAGLSLWWKRRPTP